MAWIARKHPLRQASDHYNNVVPEVAPHGTRRFQWSKMCLASWKRTCPALARALPQCRWRLRAIFIHQSLCMLYPQLRTSNVKEPCTSMDDSVVHTCLWILVVIMFTRSAFLCSGGVGIWGLSIFTTMIIVMRGGSGRHLRLMSTWHMPAINSTRNLCFITCYLFSFFKNKQVIAIVDLGIMLIAVNNYWPTD